MLKFNNKHELWNVKNIIKFKKQLFAIDFYKIIKRI